MEFTKGMRVRLKPLDFCADIPKGPVIALAMHPYFGKVVTVDHFIEELAGIGSFKVKEDTHTYNVAWVCESAPHTERPKHRDVRLIRMRVGE